MKHTHRGTCQVCGAIQAAAANRNNRLAKHGYTVEMGWGFNGTCSGSDELPLEISKTITEATIKSLLEVVIPNMHARLAGLKNGSLTPVWTKRVKLANFRHEDVECIRQEISDYEAKSQVESAIWKIEGNLRSAKQHIVSLRNLIETRHGQPLYPIADEARKEIKAGVTVRIGGKKGWTGEVVDVRVQVARGCGPYMNGRAMPHAIINHPKGGTIPIPVRTIRQDAILS